MLSQLRSLARHLVLVVIDAVALPYAMAHKILIKVIDADRSVLIVSEAISLVPDGLGTVIRRRFYRRVLAGTGVHLSVSFGTVFTKVDTRVGDHVYLGRNCAIGLTDIGDDVMFGDSINLMSGRRQHGYDDVGSSMREQAGGFERISIGQGAWIGTGAVIMADVGAHAIVGAGSVVVRPVPEYAIVVGNPAKVLRDRRSDAG